MPWHHVNSFLELFCDFPKKNQGCGLDSKWWRLVERHRVFMPCNFESSGKIVDHGKSREIFHRMFLHGVLLSFILEIVVYVGQKKWIKAKLSLAREIIVLSFSRWRSMRKKWAKWRKRSLIKAKKLWNCKTKSKHWWVRSILQIHALMYTPKKKVQLLSPDFCNLALNLSMEKRPAELLAGYYYTAFSFQYCKYCQSISKRLLLQLHFYVLLVKNLS